MGCWLSAVRHQALIETSLVNQVESSLTHLGTTVADPQFHLTRSMQCDKNM
jgi:hypothetical protein